MSSSGGVSKIRGQASFYDHLGEIPLLKSEKLDAFLQLRAEIEKILQPETFFEFAEVQDIAIAIWEIFRFRRAQVGLIESPRNLAGLLSFAVGDDHELNANRALGYFGQDPRKATEARRYLNENGLSSEQVEADAILGNITVVTALDKLIESRIRIKNDLIERAMKRLHLAAARNIDAGIQAKMHSPVRRLMQPRTKRERDNGQ